MPEVMFTVNEARELIPQVRPLLEELALATAEVLDPERRLRLSMLTEANSSTAGIAPLIRPAEAASRLLREITGLGIEVKDPAVGLIDFPAQRDGEPIYLCWRLGEDTVTHWHDRDAGFAGRRPL